jgi:glycosyltransferase involved in cell wall biosynthesis
MLEEKIRQASFVVTISEHNRQFLASLYQDLVTQKIFVIHCGIDPEVFQVQPSKQSNHPFTIICVARLEVEKGHRYLIETCGQLRDQHVNFRCLLIGDGRKRSEIEAQIRQLNLTEHITLLGFQPRDRVLQLLAEADVMVLPSIVTERGGKEGIPVALMEALAMGLPVISTATSGIPELIEDGTTGLLVPERDAEALTRAVVKLFRTRDFGQQLGAKGRIKVVKEFNLSASAANLYKLFTQQLSKAKVSTG